MNLNALVILVPLALLLTLVGRRWQIFPHQPLVWVAAVPAILSLAILFQPALWWPLLLLDGIVLGMVLVDFFSLARPKNFSVQRQVGLIASLGKPHPVKLTISNHNRRMQLVWIRDGFPTQLKADPDELLVELAPKSRTTLEYQLFASRRGAFRCDSVFLRVRSRWGLWQRMIKQPLASTINVYPDMQQLTEYALLARTNRLSLMGVRRTRKLGQDNEFERLRD